MQTADVYVFSREPGVNAYADQWNNVGVLGGLVELSGSDGEVAAVLAHELAHVMYGHVEKKFKNALVGAALAGGFTAYAQNRGGYYDGRALENAMALGATVGSRAYSPEMEIEADRTAIYILREAGFSTVHMRNFIVRMSRTKPAKSRFFGLLPSRVGFLQTHPSNDRRIAHILLAIEDSANGVPLKVAGR